MVFMNQVNFNTVGCFHNTSVSCFVVTVMNILFKCDLSVYIVMVGCHNYFT